MICVKIFAAKPRGARGRRSSCKGLYARGPVVFYECSVNRTTELMLHRCSRPSRAGGCLCRRGHTVFTRLPAPFSNCNYCAIFNLRSGSRTCAALCSEPPRVCFRLDCKIFRCVGWRGFRDLDLARLAASAGWPTRKRR